MKKSHFSLVLGDEKESGLQRCEVRVTQTWVIVCAKALRWDYACHSQGLGRKLVCLE